MRFSVCLVEKQLKDVYFQFSLWDSEALRVVGELVPYIFQFSLWDSPDSTIQFLELLKPFNSLYEILRLLYIDYLISNNFQFSLWDSKVEMKTNLRRYSFVFQFSLWDSVKHKNDLVSIRYPFNSLYEILFKFPAQITGKLLSLSILFMRFENSFLNL